MDIDEKRTLSDELNDSFRFWRSVNRKVDRLLLVILLLAFLMAGCALMEDIAFLRKGMGNVQYHSFEELLAINPDTVAWLTIDDTHIDHPVVQGKDNYEYLNIAFTGEEYAGGSLFLDKDNSSDFSDAYNIIHGHEMDAGAMFGDLNKFKNRKFFAEHQTGTLLTPQYDYDLRVIAAGTFNAYDSEIYTVGDYIPADRINKGALRKRAWDYSSEAEGGDTQILALSTCSGEMNDDRTVVFCEMTGKRKHR